MMSNIIMNFSCKFTCKVNMLRYMNFQEVSKLNYSRYTQRLAVSDRDKSLRQGRKRQKVEKPKDVPIKKVVQDESIPNFTILKKDDFLLTKLLMPTRMRKSKHRERKEIILLEGLRLIQDALDANVKLQTLLFSRLPEVKKLSLPKESFEIYKVPYASLQLWSDVKTTPGIMGIFALPNLENTVISSSIPLTIICDNVRDPGNLGSILRAAAGVGCQKVILMKGCVDLWDSKVLRGAAGAHFHVPIHPYQSWEDLFRQISPDSHVFIADNNYDINPDSTDGSKEKIIEAVSYVDEKSHGNSESVLGLKSAIRNFVSTIPIVPYYAVDYKEKELILIIGGETESFSVEAIDLFDKFPSVRINIPLVNCVESLNNSMALGIVAFEIKRQLIQNTQINE